PFLGHSIRIADEDERYRLLKKKPLIALNPHQPSAGYVHEHVPEVALGAFLGEQVSANKESHDEPNLQPLVDAFEASEVVKTVREPHRDTNQCQGIKPAWRILRRTAERDDEAQHHGRDSARFHRGGNPIAMTYEDRYPWRQTDEVHHPGCNSPLSCSCIVTAIARSLRKREENLVEEVEPSSKPL